VTRLTEALELLHSADQRWTSIQAEGTEWVARRVQSEAIRNRMHRLAGATRGSGRGFRPVFGTIQARADPPDPMTSTWRAWLRQPADSRTEMDHPGMPTITHIRRGATWWTWSGDEPATSNLGDEGRGSGPVIQAATLLRPADLLPHAEFKYVRRTAVNGRPGVTLLAEPRPKSRVGELAIVGLIGDLYRLVVDEERGVVVRLESWHQGAPLQRVKFNRIIFDGGFDDGLLKPPERVMDAAAQSPGRTHFWQLDKLAAAAAHPVFVPPSLEFPVDSFPALWFHGPSGDIDEGDPEKGRRASVQIHYSIVHAGRQGTLWMQESIAPFVLDEDKEWHKGDGVRTRHGGTGSQVRLIRDGVFVHLECDVYSIEELARLAQSLDVLPTQPPPLVTVR